MISPKVFALAGVTIVDSALLILQGANTTPGELVVGAGAGGTISVAVWWVYKNTVDGHTKTLDRQAEQIAELFKTKLEKEDLEPLHDSLQRVENSLESITSLLMRGGPK